MKQDTVKKIAAIVIFALIGLYGYFSVLLGPLDETEVRSKKEIAELTPLVGAAEKEIAKTRALERSDPATVRARQLRETLDATIPGGAPIAWFPQRLSEFFAAHDVRSFSSQLTSETVDGNFPGFKVSVWQINVNNIGFAQIGSVLAALENHEGLAQITGIEINTNLSNPEQQSLRLDLSTLVK